jgi:hypothetical protein
MKKIATLFLVCTLNVNVDIVNAVQYLATITIHNGNGNGNVIRIKQFNAVFNRAGPTVSIH